VGNQYNNYDVSFHNTLWATGLIGGFTTGMEWDWPLIHRWQNANPQELGDNVTLVFSNPPNIPITIQSYYHNYKRLSEFMSLIDFNDNLTPLELYDQTNQIECYYLQGSSADLTYGWVHNLNSYWYNTYYYSSTNERYSYCTAPPSPYDQTITIPSGFTTGHQYSVTFYPTRLGTQTLPSSYTYTSIAGELELQLGSVTLGCDTTNADFAFVIDDLNLNRLQAYSEDDSEFDFNLFPNPTNDKFTISFFHSFMKDEQKELTIQDILGQLVYKETIPQKNNFIEIDFSDKPKGMYFVTVKNSQIEKTKKIIIH